MRALIPAKHASHMKIRRFSVLKSRMAPVALLPVFFAWITQVSAQLTDSVIFGSPESEQAHAFSSANSTVVTGGLGQSARKLNPPATASWQGGTLAFTMRVDPAKQNYVTLRLWGSDVSDNQLVLFCDGKQIGYKHLGDYTVLDKGSPSPLCEGRFFYNTCLLPLTLTKDKSEVRLEIRANGPNTGADKPFEAFQMPMTYPSRGIYRIYSHLESCFAPPAEEKQGEFPAKLPIRAEPKEEIIETVKTKVNEQLESMLNNPRFVTPANIDILAQAYYVKWTLAYHNPKVIEQSLAYIDAQARDFLAKHSKPWRTVGGTMSDWIGLGRTGQVLNLLKSEILPYLDQALPGKAGEQITRRKAWADMLVARRDLHISHRRSYTNQAIVNDVYGIYLTNKGIAAISPERALPENKARQYIYEAIGIIPWFASNRVEGEDTRFSRDFRLFTKKGLSRELGYVGEYGEVLGLLTQAYYATAEPGSRDGDPRIKAQLINALHARAAFRYPNTDDDRNQAMRMECFIGWRDNKNPGPVTYCFTTGDQGSELFPVAATLDPQAIGIAQQLFADNQFFKSLEPMMQSLFPGELRALLSVPDDYELVKRQAKSSYRLPMTRGQPDFVFSDEEDGVVAIKHGDEILYASLYWRAHFGINFLARVHHITPLFDRNATVQESVEYTPQKRNYIRQNWTSFGFANGGPKPPGEVESAHTGERLPIAKHPDDVEFAQGKESIYAGRGDFYVLHFGKYTIAMNCSGTKTLHVDVPAGKTDIKELVSKSTVKAGASVNVPPMTTIVLYEEDEMSDNSR